MVIVVATEPQVAEMIIKLLSHPVLYPVCLFQQEENNS